MGYLSAVFYYFFGFVSAVYVVLLWFKIFYKTSEPQSKAVKFYLNMFFLDRKELLRNIVRSKVSRNMPVVRALSKRAAVALLNNTIVEKVAVNLCKIIPDNLGKMGVRCSVNVIYTKAAFVCIEVAMYKIDIPTLIEYNAGEMAILKIKKLIERVSFPKLNELINQFLLNFFLKKLLEKLPMQLKTKLQDKMYADVELFSCNEDDLGPFLAQTMNQLNRSEDYVGTPTTAVPDIEIHSP